MKVRCTSNRGDDFEPPYYAPEVGKPVGQVFHLTVGRAYTVYAVGFGAGGTWVYLADDVFVDGPHCYPLCLFSLEDASVSSTWQLGVSRDDSEQPVMLAPAAWLESAWFFNRVFDGEADAVAAFAEMKRQIDAEVESG